MRLLRLQEQDVGGLRLLRVAVYKTSSKSVLVCLQKLCKVINSVWK